MTSFVDTYYQQEWKQKCSKDERFLASWQGLALSSHFMLIVFLPIYTFTAFCILIKTPRSMNSVKVVLLNSHIWCSYVDILICSLITPYFYFPTISGFPVGLLRVLSIPTSIQTYMGVVSSFFMGSSLVALFENRSSCIPTNRFRMTKCSSRFLYYSLICSVYALYPLPAFLSIPDQAAAKAFLLNEIPCPTEEFFYTEVFVLAVDGPWKTYLWVATGLMMVTVFGQLGFYAICCVYYLYISTTVMLSSRTRKYQKSFFLGTIAQAFVPFVFIAIPVSAAISCIYFKYYNQVLNCAIVLFFSLHGFASTLVILLVHHPYRCYLIRVITFDRSVVKNVSTGASVLARDARAEMRRLSTRIHPY